MAFHVAVRACGGAVGTTHIFDTASEVVAFLAGVEASVALQVAEVLVQQHGRVIERRVVGSGAAAPARPALVQSA